MTVGQNLSFVNEGMKQMVLKKEKEKKKFGNSASLIITILVVFCILGGVVYSIERKISIQMSEAAIENLSENLELLKGTIQAILNKEAEFQSMLADEIALMDQPEE